MDTTLWSQARSMLTALESWLCFDLIFSVSKTRLQTCACLISNAAIRRSSARLSRTEVAKLGVWGIVDPNRTCISEIILSRFPGSGGRPKSCFLGAKTLPDSVVGNKNGSRRHHLSQRFQNPPPITVKGKMSNNFLQGRPISLL